MRHVVGLAVVAGLLAGCGRTEPPPGASDPLAADAAALPPGQVKVLPVSPAAVPADAAEARFEWAVLCRLTPADVPDDHRAGATGRDGWAVTRYVLTVKPVGPAEARAIPEEERVAPRPGMRFVRHEGELRWAKYVPGAADTHGTAGNPHHVPGTPRIVHIREVRFGGAFGGPAPEPKAEVFKPWTYSAEVKDGPLAGVLTNLLTEPRTVELPAVVPVLRVGDAVTSLDLR
jgi:hypothetical protein